MIIVNIEAVRESAAHKPAGYLDAVFAAGTIDGDYLLIPDAEFDQLLREYANHQPRCGPGCQLKRLLSRVGIEPRPGCKCNERAAIMDSLGPDECAKKERTAEIIEWLKEEADIRGIPFVEALARLLVKRAIQLARSCDAS